jgi:GTP-binding protein HflX
LIGSEPVQRPGAHRQRVVLLQPTFGPPLSERAQEEFRLLAESAGCDIVASLTARRDQPDARTLIGRGKVDELRDAVGRHEAGLVLVNHRLTPIQERNLSRDVGVAVLDRTTLILDIFAQRARSHEGKLQVELAQLDHLATRLVRGWTHLERQRGGIGMRGPGETQLETDRRLLAGRIRSLKRRLDRVEQHRARGRQSRARNALPVAALVGYTNAGKSTLFNRLTAGEVVARDQLFATLDPTVRRIDDLNGGAILASDTVGFIQDLPHELVAAFHATLEETRSASLVVHVIDASDPDRETQIATVEQVLDQIGAGDLPRLRVYNKIDLTDAEPGAHRDEAGQVVQVRCSAQSGIGLDALRAALAERVGGGRIRIQVVLPPTLPRLRARLFELGAIEDEHIHDDGSSRLQIDLSRRDALELSRLSGRDGSWVSDHLLK